MKERALLFACGGDHLIGVLAEPSRLDLRSDIGMVVVVGGPQYRAGSHRQFVQLARAVAAGGHTALRFDVRGMGDSTGTVRGFEAIGLDVAAAVDALLREAPHVRQTVLMGLCDGASAALMYMQATRDARVAGLCLLNPWARSQGSLARTRVKHYYLQRLGQRDFWRKLARGAVGSTALAGLIASLRNALSRPRRPPGNQTSPDFRMAMRGGCETFRGPQLIALSSNDLTAREFADLISSDPLWKAAVQRPTVSVARLPAADHTLSRAEDRAHFESVALRWLAGIAGTAPA